MEIMLKERNIKIAVFFALLVSLFIAFIFNLTLSVGEGTVMPLSNGDWLNFWGSYAGSVLALVVGLIAIFYTNANCEQTLLQQNKILNYQQTIKEQEERNVCLKNNLNLLNYAEIQGITASINQNDLISSKEKIVNKKAEIYSCDLQLRYVYGYDLNEPRPKEEQTYKACWEQCISELSVLLDKQLELVMRIAQNQSDLSMKNGNSQIISNAESLLKLGVTLEQKIEYENTIMGAKSEMLLLDKKINAYVSDINLILTAINMKSEELLKDTKRLFDLSIVVQKANREKCKI